jgi:serine/threonine protein kinase
MSPEQAAGKPVDSRSDVFAFGIVLCELMTGQRPFRGETPTAIIAKILEAEPELLQSTHFPPKLVRIIRRCLEKVPDDRYSHTHDLVEDLADVRRRLSKTSAQFSAVRRGSSTSSLRVAGLRQSTLYQLIIFVLLLLVTGPLSYFVFVRIERGRETGALSRAGALRPDPQPSAGVGPSSRTSTGQSRQRADGTGNQSAQTGTPPRAATLEEATISRGSPGATAGVRVGQRTDPSLTSRRASGDADRISARAGLLTMSSNPKSSVTLDGDLVGVTPTTVEARAGTHEIAMSSAEGLHWRGRIQVVAGEKSRLHRELTAEGRLTITAENWAEITLDDGPPEQTPVHFSHIAAGLHELRAFREGYVPQASELTIEQGNTTYVRLKLEKQP